MKSPVLSLIAGLSAIAFAAGAQAQQVPQPTLPIAPLSAGIYVIQAEVASTPMQQQIGLMGRTALSSNGGMLFIFDASSLHCMWMRNTLLPLSVAFIDDNGSITNIEDMAPKTENTHCAVRPARYALEMSKGWFAKRGIKPGTTIEGLKKP
mgnify:CR=1 FL=1